MYLTDSYGGLRIMRIYHLQGYSKMKFMCIHTRNMDATGKLLQISLRFTQLKCGLSKPFYSYNFYKTHFLVTPTWFTNIWQYLTECHTQFHHYDPWLYSVPRQHDFLLNIKWLTASDIVYCDRGNKILPHILQGYNYRKSSYNWPNEYELPKKWIQTFSQIIKEVTQPQLFSTPLGKWIRDGHQKWAYFLDFNKQIISCLENESNHLGITPVDIQLLPENKVIAT